MKALTDTAIRNAKRRVKKYRLAAGGGLCLVVMPDGAKYWRLRYRDDAGKAKELAVGSPYPTTSLADARAEAERLKAERRKGRDPSEQRRALRLAKREAVAETFGDAANAWHAYRTPKWSPRTAAQVRDYLDKDLMPKLQHRPLSRITPPELGAIVAGVEARGAFDVAGKVRTWLRAIFAFARAKGWVPGDIDPAKDLAAVASTDRPEAKNHAHLEAAELPAFLRDLDAYQGSYLVKACARLSLWTANRPGVTRTLRWSEVDLDGALWTIERGREGMKRGYYHLTPLPTQAVALLCEVHKLTGTFEYVFAGRNDPMKPLSDGAVNVMLKKIGYRGKQTAHGFRHVASTALNELGYERDWIERQLAHKDPDAIRGTYNKAQYLEPRRKMMQAWADKLDAIKTGATVLPFRKCKTA